MASNDPNATTSAAYIGEDFIPDDIPELLKDDPLVAFLRCRYAERATYLEHLDDELDRVRIEEEKDRIENLKKTFGAEERNKSCLNILKYWQAEWKNSVIASREDSRAKLEARLNDMIAQKKPKLTPETEEKQREFKEKRRKFEENILDEVDKWERVTLEPKPPELGGTEGSQEAPKRSIFSKVADKFKKQKSSKEQKPTRTVYPESRPTQNREFPLPEDSYGINIIKVTLKKSHDGTSPFFRLDENPPKRYPLKDILELRSENPLRKIDGTDTIRYFHFPANNMHWVEEAIARYYGEETPGEFNYRQSVDPPYCKQASNLLCRKYWTSLQHGGVFDPVHARHLRPQCSLITPENGSSADQIKGSKNFVMFMPYLHWETHRRRKEMAAIIKEITNQHHRDRPHFTESLREELASCTEQIIRQHARQLSGLPNLDVTETGLSTKSAKEREKKKKKDQGQRSTLGEYLLQAAKIYDMMDVDPDVRILRDHLYKDPPLHARRTLDQSYYWKLPTTDGRDQDQVVYRATQRGKSVLRTSRVVMVDQLWLYILDDNTIITSFPRRWGRNKPDWSGVHRAIRSQLEHIRDGEIQSVYDLALLIVNQCSAVFFDRTKPVDKRPEVLDIFSNALSHVSGMKTVAFETFWRQLSNLSASEHQQKDFETTARTYLNINPEGELLRETHDIIEELRIMMGIFGQQIHIMEEFSRHLQNLHEKETSREATDEDASPSMLKVLMDIKKLLEDQQAAKEEASHTNGLLSSLLPNSSLNPSHLLGHGGSGESTKTQAAGKTIPNHTLHLAEDVIRDMMHRRGELEKLEQSTVYVCDQLKALLDLKQQQASIIEAKYALKRADESVIQGRSIMLFTIVTIIFLPLSFMSSVFGMNAKEFSSPDGGNSMSLKDQFKLLFPISLGVFVVSIALAFPNWIRSLIYFMSSVVFAVFYEYTFVRKLWNCLTRKSKSDVLHTQRQKIVEKIYGRKKRRELLSQWREAQDRERREKDGGYGGYGGYGGAGGGGSGGDGDGTTMTTVAGARAVGGGLNGGLNGNAKGNGNVNGVVEMDIMNRRGVSIAAGAALTPPQSRGTLGGGLSGLLSRTPKTSDRSLV